MKKILGIAAVVMALIPACTPSTATRGNYLYPEDVALVQPGASTQNDVINLLGTPTSKAVFDDNTWYYVGLQTEQKSFFDEKVTERAIYQIAFDESGFVQSVETIDDMPVQVPLARRVTPTSGNEVTALQQILGNIGKFNPPDNQ